MKTIYIVSKDTYWGHSRHLGNHNYIDLPDGQIVLSGEFHDSGREAAFVASGAVSLEETSKANPMSDYPTACTALACHGVLTTDSVHAAAAKLRKVHPQL